MKLFITEKDNVSDIVRGIDYRVKDTYYVLWIDTFSDNDIAEYCITIRRLKVRICVVFT